MGVVTSVEEAEHVWELIAKQVRDRVPDVSWLVWFADVRAASADDETLVLAAPNVVAKTKLESVFAEILKDGADAAGFSELDIIILVDPAAADPEAEVGLADDEPVPVMAGTRVSAARGASEVGHAGSRMNPRYTFDNFVIGSSNRFAHAAGQSVAETPGQSYNPLFIYGAAGLGKTHLLHAIGHYVMEHYPTYRVNYVTTETFVNDFIDAIRHGRQSQFKRQYRESDLLLVDDIQFLENAERTQEEFFHTFNHLHGLSRQIVITSDRKPDAIPTLEDRLRSRFKWGLLIDVQPPELETRLAILRNKVEHEPPPIEIDTEVLEFIAANITDNIRELEGAYTRVTAWTSLNRRELEATGCRRITLAEAATVLSDLVLHSEPHRPTVQSITDIAADEFGFGIEELTGSSRRKPLVTARQICMYVIRELTDASLPTIARAFGGRDHTTVLHAVRKISTEMRTDAEIFERVQRLSNRAKGREA